MPFFFFFQAEDGIRDTSVTGVQTCALPICRSTPSTSRNTVTIKPSISCWIARSSRNEVSIRSEERREGKSVDLGGRRVIKKKKKKRTREDCRIRKIELTHTDHDKEN